MRYVCPAIRVAILLELFLISTSQIQAQPPALVISDYTLKSQIQITSTLSVRTYTAKITNSGTAAFASVVATASSLNTQSIQIVSGQGILMFGVLPANGMAVSTNTFSVSVDSSVPFDWNNLQWAFQTTSAAPNANAGLNQTVNVNSTVWLNGSQSTNPSGLGTLTYSWAFTSRPPRSIAQLSANNVVSPTFVADAAGTYVIALTVSNGTASSTASVSVSTTNTIPVANAGLNKTVAVGTQVTLDGTHSSDVDGDPLTYLWSFFSRPIGSTATLSANNIASPKFVADQVGAFVLQLVVNDGHSNSDPAFVTITTQNTAPIANAGPNQVVNVHSLVQLSGANSTDVDGDPLTYRWILLTVPPGSAAILSSSTAVNPTFTADLPGTYVVQLIVNDSHQDSLPVTTTISTNVLQPPVANAGPNQTVQHGTTVVLSGSGTDPQGLSLTYSWALTTKPTGSLAFLTNPTSSNPTFIADLPGIFAAQLTVNNGFVNSTPATVTINTTNTPPVANPGSNQTVAVGANVLLDGRNSSDADHDALTFAWSITTRPPGSTAVLSSPNAATPSFTADLSGTYVIQLIASDAYSQSAPVTVTITATGSNAITVTPNPLTLGSNSSGTLTVMLSAPAGVSGQVVNLGSSNSQVAAVPLTAMIPANATGTNVSVTSGIAGNATITASAAGFVSGTTTVNVVASGLTVHLDSATVGLQRSVNGTVTLSAPAPSGLLIPLSVAPGGIVNIQPSAVLIASGGLTAPFTATGIGVGQASITASALGYGSGSANLTVTLLGQISLPSNVTVGPNQSVQFPVSLSAPAPAGGVTIALVSSDTSKLTVSTATVSIPQGATVPAAQPSVTGVNFGSATVTASAQGFTGDSKLIQIGASLSFAPQTMTISNGEIRNITLNLSAPAPAFGYTISVSSNNSGVASVPSNVIFPPNATSVNVPVTGVSIGSTTLHASAFPTLADTTANITVGALAQLGVPSALSVAAGQSVTLTVTLPAAAPAGGVSITLVSSDTSKATVPSPLVIPQGATNGSVQVAGVASGPATITASANGFSSGNTAVTVTAGAPASLTATSGSGQSAAVNTPFAFPFAATVKSGNGNPISGAVVTFTAPSNGASGTFPGGATTATATTNTFGVATSPAFAANGTSGQYNVVASIANLTANYPTTNTGGPPPPLPPPAAAGRAPSPIALLPRRLWPLSRTVRAIWSRAPP